MVQFHVLIVYNIMMFYMSIPMCLSVDATNLVHRLGTDSSYLYMHAGEGRAFFSHAHAFMQVLDNFSDFIIPGFLALIVK